MHSHPYRATRQGPTGPIPSGIKSCPERETLLCHLLRAVEVYSILEASLCALKSPRKASSPIVPGPPLARSNLINTVPPTHSVVSHSEFIRSYLDFIYLPGVAGPAHVFLVPALRLVSTIRYQECFLRPKVPRCLVGGLKLNWFPDFSVQCPQIWDKVDGGTPGGAELQSLEGGLQYPSSSVNYDSVTFKSQENAWSKDCQGVFCRVTGTQNQLWML